MAEEGIAAHWKYKEGRVGDQRDDRYFQWMRQLLESQQEVRDPQEFIQNLKVELYPEEVYTFTPKGLVKALPAARRRSISPTSIHTDVGHQCVGARVNGKMVPLRTRLQNGDIVEIVTQAGHKPSRDWLNVRGDVARPQQDQASHSLGREDARDRARAQGVREGSAPLRPQSENASSRATASPRRCRTSALAKADDLFAAIGYGKIQPKHVFVKLVPADKLREQPPDGAVASVRAARASGTGEEKIKVARLRRPDGLPRALLQSDPRREDRRLHHARQGRVGPFRHLPERRQPALRPGAPHRRRVGQGRATVAAVYRCKLTMEVENRQGLLAAVSTKIADINTNIKNIEARTDEDQRARIDMTVEISDLKHLEKVIKAVRGVEGVIGVERAAR
mgnify:CR=1 FL=1